MISKKEIDDEGKAQYVEWRSNKDRLKMLQAEQAVFTGQEIKVAGVLDYFKSEEELDLQYEKDIAKYEADKNKKIKKAEDEQKRNIKEGRGKHESRYEFFPGGAQRDIDRAKNIVKNPYPKKPKGYDKRKSDAADKKHRDFLNSMTEEEQIEWNRKKLEQKEDEHRQQQKWDEGIKNRHRR